MNRTPTRSVRIHVVLTSALPLLLPFALDSVASAESFVVRHASHTHRSTTSTRPRARNRLGTRRKAPRPGRATASTTKTKKKTRTIVGKRWHEADDRFVGVRRSMKRERSARTGPVTVYLNGRGGRIRGGYEDSSINRSSLVWSEGLSAIDVPAYAGGSRRWSEMVSCVQGHLGDYDIRVTDRRPEDGPYIMMMVGGRSSMLRYPGSVAGVAPYTGSVVEDAIGFVFSRTIGGGAHAVCETASHEIGHTLGLDHTYECSDLMSYLGGCGEKSFRDESMRCGEWDDRRCSGGQRHQNSHQRLASALGLRPSRPEPTPPSRPEPTLPPRIPTTPADTRGPRISVHSAGGSTFEAESIFIVQFDVYDDSGLESLELLWQVDGRTLALRCGDLPDELPVECGMIGGSYAFALAVGAGERKYAIRVTDEAGNRSTTRWRRASFVEPDQDEDWDEGGSCD